MLPKPRKMYWIGFTLPSLPQKVNACEYLSCVGCGIYYCTGDICDVTGLVPGFVYNLQCLFEPFELFVHVSSRVKNLSKDVFEGLCDGSWHVFGVAGQQKSEIRVVVFQQNLESH